LHRWVNDTVVCFAELFELFRDIRMMTFEKSGESVQKASGTEAVAGVFFDTFLSFHWFIDHLV